MAIRIGLQGKTLDEAFAPDPGFSLRETAARTFDIWQEPSITVWLRWTALPWPLAVIDFDVGLLDQEWLSIDVGDGSTKALTFV